MVKVNKNDLKNKIKKEVLKDINKITNESDKIEVEQKEKIHADFNLDDSNEDELRAEILEEIMNELKKNNSNIQTHYNVDKNIIDKVIKPYEKYIKDYKEQVIKITERYNKKIAYEKIKELELDLIGEKSYWKNELDFISNKHKSYLEKAIENNLSDPEYKESKKEALDILLHVGNKLDAETTYKLIKPIIEAKDITTIKVLKATTSEQAEAVYYMAERVINEYLEQAGDIEELTEIIKAYIDNNATKDVRVETYIYNVDQDYYNSRLEY